MEKYKTVEAWRAHLAEGLTPEDWATLNAQALSDSHPKLPSLTFPKLPPAPTAHTLTAERHLAQMIKACGKYDGGARAYAYVGRPYPGGYVVRATNGHISILQKGECQGELVHRVSPADTHTIRLDDPRFELVLRRALVCANERSHAIKFTGTQQGKQIGLLLEAGPSDHYHNASTSSTEFFPCDLDAELIGSRWCLSGDYLLACCGRWPWRWEIGRGRPTVDEAAVSPHAIYWDADGTAILIVPMRI